MEKKLREITGYPHLDQLHKQYYGEKGQKNIDINKTMFRYLKDRVSAYDGVALSFYGQEIMYSDFMNKVLRTATSLHNLGLKKGDRVTFLLPSMPDTYYIFYALDMLGVERNIVDLRTSVDGIRRYINETNTETLFCMTNYSHSNVKELMNTTCVKRVITVDAPLVSVKNNIIRTLGSGIIWAESFGYRSLGESIIMPDDFRNIGLSSPIYDVEAPHEKDEVTLYLHTSGTMKFPKTIESTDENQNFVAAQYEKSLMDLQVNDSFLAIMPPWIFYGIMGFHMPLSLGMTVYPIPDPAKAKFEDLVLDLKPNVVAGVPNHFISLLESKRITSETDLSYCKVYACGGAPINSEKQAELTEFLLRHGSKCQLNPGYAYSENTSVGTANQADYCKLGSVGIPLPDVEVLVIDRETHEPLKYNETGIICLRGSLMKGYLNDEEETKKVFIEIDGKKWVISGDIGHVDEEGYVFIEGREKNVIIRHDGFKIAPNEIESVVCQHPEVKNCIVFGVKDNKYEFGDNPVAFVEFKDKNRTRTEIAQIMREIKKICEKTLSSYYLPYAYYVGKIQFTPMMKDDKKAMRDMFMEEEQRGAIKKLVLGSHIYK